MDHQILKGEIFNSLRQRGEVELGPTLIPGILRNLLKAKYGGYHIDDSELEIIGGELMNDGYFTRNSNGFLAITQAGINHLKGTL